VDRPLPITPDGGPIDATSITLEQALFPYLFPLGAGHWDGHRTLPAYLRLRSMQLFSPFTLCKNYMLLMFHVRQAAVLARACSEQVLQRDINSYRSAHPNATDEDIVHHVLKHCVPAAVPGSPQYFKQQLLNLLALVEKKGLPHFSLTLTADEASALRWTEINDLESLLNAFCNGWTFKEAPVECATHFLRRCKDFLAEHILRSDGSGILGRVEDYVIRYEVQDRGSLHAHIIIWLELADVDTVGSEISACVPAAFDEESNAFVPPTDPNELTLFNMVTKKQMHTCRPDGCLNNNHSCRYGFPCDTQPERTLVFNCLTNRYHYYRPRYADRNVVPYHPVLLLLWGAHMNLQHVTQTAWSFYVLKYAMKGEPAGKLNIDTDAMASLGLDHMPPAQLATASALILSKPISIAEATLIFLEEPAVQASAKVHFVSVSPPYMRKRVLRCNQVIAAPVDKYASRPAHLEAMTLYEYFSVHLVGMHGGVNGSLYVGKDGFDNRVWYSESLVVRFTSFHPVYHADAFFYTVLLRKVPFRIEHSLLSSGNTSKTYFEECCLRGILTSMADLESMLQAYAEYLGSMGSRASCLSQHTRYPMPGKSLCWTTVAWSLIATRPMGPLTPSMMKARQRVRLSRLLIPESSQHLVSDKNHSAVATS